MDNKSQKVETFSGDMVEALSHPEEGMIKKIIEGEEKHDEEKKNFSPDSSKNKLLMFASVFLLIVAIGALFVFFFNRDALTVEVAQQFTPLIFIDDSVLVPVDKLPKDDITKNVLTEVTNSKVKKGAVLGIYLTENKKAIGLRRLFALIKGNLAFSKDSFIGDNFLIGMFNEEAKDSKDLFILMKMRSHTDAFADMRAWENKMFSDLHGFFGYDITPDTSYLLTKDFEDGVIQNQNARILYDKDGKIVMAYIYADDTSILITNTEEASHEVIARLASSRVKK